MTSLTDYVERMKEKQDAIYFVAGSSRQEVENSPFVERLLKKGFEVLYLVEAIDEHCIQSLPEFSSKKFQNVAKEGLNLNESEKAKEQKETVVKEYETLTAWLKEEPLKDLVSGKGRGGSGGGEGVRDADRLVEGGAAQGSGEWEGEGRGGERRW